MKIVLTQNGEALPHVSGPDNRTFFIVPDEGGEFEVQVGNHTGFRMEAVIAVDGVNVLNGERATYEGPGYLVRPRSGITIPGWSRGDNENVARFTFEQGEHSYVSQMGLDTSAPQSVGVAFFGEKHDRRPRSRSGVTEAHSILGASRSVGAGYGREAEFQTQEVAFTRGSTSPYEVGVVEYATRTQLAEWGIPVPPPKPVPFQVHRTPGVKEPASWQG